MTISRRAVLTGIGAAAIAPALPSVAEPVRRISMVGLPLYGLGPMMTATEVIARWNATQLPDVFKPEDFDGILQLIEDEEADSRGKGRGTASCCSA